VFCLNETPFSRIYPELEIYRMIKKNGLDWRVNGVLTHARQLVGVFQVVCSLYGLTCVGYAQNSLEFVSRSPLIHVVGRSFSLYTDSLFALIGDSNDKCSSSLEVECWNEERNARCTAVADSVLMNSQTQKILCCIVAILLSNDTTERLCAMLAL